MVKNKFYFILCFILCFFTSKLFFSETILSAKIGFTTGILYIDEKNPVWFSAGNAQVQIDTGIKDSVKATITAKYSIDSVSGIGSFLLDKAYMKMRFPFLYENYLRVSIGKMPLSWGYGLYYNAGDIVFGLTPHDASSFDTSLFRTSTAWMSTIQIPFTDFLFVELAFIPQFNTVSFSHLVSQTSSNTLITTLDNILGSKNNTNKKAKFGGRLFFQTNLYALQSVEFGMLTSADLNAFGNENQIYTAIDGSIWFDYNFCISTSLLSNDTINSISRENILKQQTALSISIFKNFIISTTYDYQLSIREELLYYPLIEKISMFTLFTFNWSSSLNNSFIYIISVENNLYSNPKPEHILTTTLNFLPVKGLQLSLQGTINISNPRKFSMIGLNASYSF